MVGLLVSLLLVVYSINQNTVALRGATGNLLFELHADLQSTFLEDASLAAIVVKLEGSDPQLTDVERVRWTKYRHNLLDLWAMAYQRHLEGLMTEEEWDAWNQYFVYAFAEDSERMTLEEWRSWAYGWDPGFWAWVGDALGFPAG